MPRSPQSQEGPTSRFDMLANEQGPEPTPEPAPTGPLMLETRLVIREPDGTTSIPAPTPEPSQNPNSFEVIEGDTERTEISPMMAEQPARLVYLGLEVRDILRLIKIRPRFTKVPMVATNLLDGARHQVMGFGTVMVRGLDLENEFDREEEGLNRCRCLYIRPNTYGLQSVSFKQLMHWLTSLAAHYRLHATDGARIFPVVGIRWLKSDGADSWREWNLHFSLGPEVTG